MQGENLLSIIKRDTVTICDVPLAMDSVICTNYMLYVVL